MMKKIYTLLLFAAFSISAIYAQTVTINENPTGTSANIVFGTLAYHASEYLYRTGELGDNTFTTNAITEVGFNVGTVGTNTTFNNINIYMRSVSTATNVLVAGTYSTAGYTLVYSGPVTMSATGFTNITLDAPFTRNFGENLLVLIERRDNTPHTGFVFVPSLDDPTGAAATNVCRRYNGAAALSAATSLSASTFRAAIRLRGALPVDATFSDLTLPGISCFSTSQSADVVLKNFGTTPIAAGAASVAFDLTGANTYSATLNNAGVIAPNGTETITFSGFSLSTPGTTDYSIIVSLPGDGDAANDSIFTSGITATNISTFPAVEDVETTLPLISYVSTLAGAQAWSLQNFGYLNVDLADSLHPYSGENFFLFDSYNFAAGTSTRLFSNCVTLTRSVAPTSNALTFFMSHDTSYVDFPDSIYVSISEDKGATWTRIAGFARYDAAFVFPDWRQETVDLSAYGCKTIQIGFEAIGAFGNVMGLDDITINSTGDLNCAVPVTLVGFTVQKLNKANRLTWKTSQELNTLKFVVEQSRNGREFIELGQVAAAGNSSTERTYTYTHNLPEKGYNYYRIKMVDIDNTAKYSAVRSLQNLGINEISSYPNPVRNSMQVAINAEKSDIANVQITDLSGKTVFTKAFNITEGDNSLIINTTGFTAGNYILKVQLSGDVVVKKFSKL